MARMALEIALAGIGGSLFMDLWLWLQGRFLGIPMPGYAMVGRWVGHFPGGRFRHDSIAAAAPVPHERVLGWTVHFLTGIAYAAALTLLAGPGWLDGSRPLLAVGFGMVTVVMPWFVMQPGMGLGVLSRRTPAPVARSLRSLGNHTVFGIGLALSAVLIGALR